MSRPLIAAASQQSRGSYPPPASTSQGQRLAERRDDTTVTMRAHQPDKASARSHEAWLSISDTAIDHRDYTGDDDDEAGDDEADQHRWRRALSAVSAINEQITALCSHDGLNAADLVTLFRALKALRATSQLSLLVDGGEDRICPALGPALVRLINKLSSALGGSLELSDFDIASISAICGGLCAALGTNHGDSLFTTVQLGKLRQPLRMVVDALMRHALVCGLPADQKSNHELLSILKLLSRGLKLRFTDPEGRSDTLLSKTSPAVSEVLWKSLLVIRDWPAHPDEKGGNLSSTGMLDTRQLGVVMVQLNTMHKQMQRDLDDDIEEGLTGRQLLGQCALKLCGGNALDEFKLWSRHDDASSMARTVPVLERAPLSSVVVANIANTIKDFFGSGLIPAASPALPAIVTRLLRWMRSTLQSGEAAPESQSFSNFANFLRIIVEPSLRGQALPVEEVADYDDLCRQVLEVCATLKPVPVPGDGDIQHLTNLASFIKAMARRQQLAGHLYRKAADRVVSAMAGHAAEVRQPESFSGLLAASVYFMQSGLLAVQAVQALVGGLMKNGSALVKPYWPASLRQQLLQATVCWLADVRVTQFGESAAEHVLPLFDVIFICRKPDDEPLPYLKALELIAQRHPTQLQNYLNLLSVLAGRPVALAEAPAAIAQAILGYTAEAPVVEIVVDEPLPAPLPVPVPLPLPKATPAVEPARPGSASWQPIGGVLARSPATTESEVDDGKATAGHKAKRKKHRAANRERLPRSEPVTTTRHYAATAALGAVSLPAASVSKVDNISKVDNVVNIARAGQNAASITATTKLTSTTNITTTSTTTTTTTATTVQAKPTPTPTPTPKKAPVAAKPKAAPASLQPKGTPKEQWQFHFMKSRDDSIQGLEALLATEASLLMQKIGSGSSAQPALCHAISRGLAEKTNWLLTQMIWQGIALDRAFAFSLLDEVFSQATLVEYGHQQAVKHFLLACENSVPDWGHAFVDYLSSRSAMIPPAYGLGAVAASPAPSEQPAKRTRRETVRTKDIWMGANKLKHEVEADIRAYTGKNDRTLPLTTDEYQAYSASLAEQLIRSGKVGDARHLLLKPNELGRIMLMDRIENRDWSMAKAHLNAKLTTAQLLATDADQRTALMMAVDQRYLPMVQDLLAAARGQGGKVLLDVLTAHDGPGFTPLLLACLNDETDIARELLGSGHVYEQLTYNNAGASAYFMAIRNGNEAVAKLLLDAASPIGLRDVVVDGIREMAARQQAHS